MGAEGDGAGGWERGGGGHAALGGVVEVGGSCDEVVLEDEPNVTPSFVLAMRSA